MAQYDVTLRDYWRILRKRKVIVIFATVMLGLTSFATALVSRPEPRFRATAKVQYEKTQTAQQAYAAALGASNDLEIQQAVIELVVALAPGVRSRPTFYIPGGGYTTPGCSWDPRVDRRVHYRTRDASPGAVSIGPGTRHPGHRDRDSTGSRFRSWH